MTAQRQPQVMNFNSRRFAAGWRLVEEFGHDLGALRRFGQRRPDIEFDVIRPLDLVAFTVEGYGVDLITGERPILRPREGVSSRLVVRFAYQHLGEHAIYEGNDEDDAPLVPNPVDPGSPPEPYRPPEWGNPEGPFEGLSPPIAALPAKTTRLVFDLTDGDEIPFSTEGILEALGRLPMLVHPLATPRPGRYEVPDDSTMLHLPGRLVATVGEMGVVVTRARAGIATPDPATAVGLAVLARNNRRLRSILAVESGASIGIGEEAGVAGPSHLTINDRIHPIPGLIGDRGLIRRDLPIAVSRQERLSRPPRQFETAIEAPFRLLISPSKLGGWSHSATPVGADGAGHRIELWHSRLGVRSENTDGVDVTETQNRQRAIRAIWARDREAMSNWDTSEPDRDDLDDPPFLMSLDGADRHILVRQSAETWLDENENPIPPQPVDARELWLSSLGAWIDLHGTWDTGHYTSADPGMSAILTWDHVAPMGRDQFVRVTYPGYLYPFGHRAVLVKVTERRMKDASPSVAGLYMRQFLVVTEPLKLYFQRNMPLTRIRLAPLVTPTLRPLTGEVGDSRDNWFWPRVGDQKYRFVLHCEDWDGRPVRLLAPLMWVSDSFNAVFPLFNINAFGLVDIAYALDTGRTVVADGQAVTFAEVNRGGDTMLQTESFSFLGQAKQGTSVPRLEKAVVKIPALEQLSSVGSVPIHYFETYVAHGFGGAKNSGEVWAEVVGVPPDLSFGRGNTAGSDRAGGFLQPNLPVAGLSRVKGAVGDLAHTATSDFDPATFLGDALPQLFGIVPLVDLLSADDVNLEDHAPAVIAEALDRITSFTSDLERIQLVADEAVEEATHLVVKLKAANKSAALLEQASQAQTAAERFEAALNGTVDEDGNDVPGIVGRIKTELANLPGATLETIEQGNLPALLQALSAQLDPVDQITAHLLPLTRQRLRSLAKTLRAAADAADLIQDMFRYLNGLDPSSLETAFRYEWKPKLKPWPSPNDPILDVQEDSLVLAVDGRASGKGEVRVEVLAELRDFDLNLLPGETLVKFRFDHLSFRAGSEGKPDVDVVLEEIEFVGLLGFVEVLKDLIPFDGFSDPPYLDVTSEGLTAGYSLALPNVAIGVFNLSNISLGADVRVPFLGEVVTVGFNFCTRERPFALAVTFIGGGGWFLLCLSPDGLDVLDLGLEAGAMLAVDFGVASGSISAMLGIYMRLEGNAGSLAAFFRLRGEVDVLGLISASIELYLELKYIFETGKMEGSASLTIKVEVFLFSTSVTIQAQRSFAGSKGDPSFTDIMIMDDGTYPAWTEYCTAFAGE